ncbi:iron dicitrate transport regulator FecR [Ramlibacter sp. G-1-2-2]|uniref:Iron dicitrate transport regulator FecR n=1 Tax=Ramlibacter agri TaxID=2728837 RepID=A0A848HB40_9BURK|nr:iron dicitrate transport regulator FecR [Ramlibacter agri]NML46700.1 iron dicitrate transport regulator FecR [Ramlibacter agri]
MSTHTLLGRTEDEVLWFRRRGVLQAAAAWAAMGGFGAAQAQQRSNIVAMQGDALLNGAPLRREQVIQTGDSIQTGPGSNLSFVIGNAALHVRENSRITVERGQTLNTIAILRMLTGAVVSVWGRGSSRQIVTPTLTAGIRGTGTYTEIFSEQSYRSYFCNCYGTVDLSAGRDSTTSQAEYHQSFWAEPQPNAEGRILTPAKAINHTDEEVEFLAGLVGQQTAWQIAGHKGVKDGSGYLR